MQRQRFLAIALGLLTLLRLALLPTVGLAPDEALAATAGVRPGGEFLEIGPAVAWLARFATWIAGNSELGVRWPAPLCALIASLVVWRVARGMFDTVSASWAVIILNALPAFNVAALHLTPSTLLYPLFAGLLYTFRTGLQRNARWHGAWWGSGALLGVLVLTDVAAGMTAFAAITLMLALPKRKRHHLVRPGYWLCVTLWGIATGWWLILEWQRGWPFLEAPGARPCWTVAPNLFRWMLLLSPGLFSVFGWSLRQISLTADRSLRHHGMLLGFALPLALIDFWWGPSEHWPDTGLAVWTLFLSMILAHQSVVTHPVPTETKVSLRTIALVLAILQSAFLMRPDLVRSLGIPWHFATIASERRTYPRFLMEDPSGAMHGWPRTSELVTNILKSAAEESKGRPWFVIARDWELAAALEFYLPADTPIYRPTSQHPRVHPVQEQRWDHPYAFAPRYDVLEPAEVSFRGLNAIYVTDDAGSRRVPEPLRRAFSDLRILSVARIMHGGQEVRTVKIFACYDYHPPEF